MKNSMLDRSLWLDGQVGMLVQFHVKFRICKFLPLIDGLFSRIILSKIILIVKRLVEMGRLIIGDASGALPLNRVNSIVGKILR